MQFLLHLCLLLATLFITSSAKNDVTYLSYDSPTIQNQVAYQDEKHSYCIRPIVAMKFFDLKLSDSSDGNDVDALFGLMHALDEVSNDVYWSWGMNKLDFTSDDLCVCYFYTGGYNN